MDNDNFEERFAAAVERMANAQAQHLHGPLPDYRLKALDMALASLGFQQGATVNMPEERIVDRAQKFYDWLVK